MIMTHVEGGYEATMDVIIQRQLHQPVAAGTHDMMASNLQWINAAYTVIKAVETAILLLSICHGYPWMVKDIVAKQTPTSSPGPPVAIIM